MRAIYHTGHNSLCNGHVTIVTSCDGKSLNINNCLCNYHVTDCKKCANDNRAKRAESWIAF